MPRTYAYSATYEFNDLKPETIRGSISKNEHHQAFLYAMKKLRKEHPNRQPSSIVIVLEIK